MDIIFIRSLKIPTIIGIYPWEREINQSLLIDVDIKVNSISESVLNDNLDNTINYEEVSNEIAHFAEKNSFKLIETFAHHLAEHLLNQFEILSIQLKIGKENTIIPAKEVGVIIERFKKS